MQKIMLQFGSEARHGWADVKAYSSRARDCGHYVTCGILLRPICGRETRSLPQELDREVAVIQHFGPRRRERHTHTVDKRYQKLSCQLSLPATLPRSRGGWPRAVSRQNTFRCNPAVALVAAGRRIRCGCAHQTSQTETRPNQLQILGFGQNKDQSGACPLSWHTPTDRVTVTQQGAPSTNVSTRNA
jgi:hypothetical protein